MNKNFYASSQKLNEPIMGNRLANILSPFIFILSMLWVKNKNRWSFGAWFGEKYDDNSRYLFEMATKDDSIECAWITKNPKIISELCLHKLPVYHAYSLSGLFYQLTSCCFFCTVNSRDFYYATITPRNILVQLWHGSPLKKIGFDIPNRTLIARTVDWMRSITIDRYTRVVSPSPYFDSIFQSAFRTPKKRILRNGYPRCDGLFIDDARLLQIRTKLGFISHEKFVFYLPTHRDQGATCDVIMKQTVLISKEFSTKNRNFKILIKPHFYDMKFLLQLRSVAHDSGVTIISDDELHGLSLYEVLAASDVLITDYSSVIFDYEILGRPILFFTPDLIEYKEKSRDLYLSWESIITNPVLNAKDLMSKLEEILSSIDIASPTPRMSTYNDDVNGQFTLKLLQKVKLLAGIATK